MGRISPKRGDTHASRRNAHLRSCAEALRLLATRATFDAEARDLTAFLIFNLRDVYRTIDEAALAWDDRNYWKKAEALREKWRWSRVAADKLEKLALKDRWQDVPAVLIELVPYFQNVTINEMTRDADWWFEIAGGADQVADAFADARARQKNRHPRALIAERVEVVEAG